MTTQRITRTTCESRPLTVTDGHFCPNRSRHKWRKPHKQTKRTRSTRLSIRNRIGSRYAASSFMGFPHISASGLARNGCRWLIFALNVRVTLRSRHLTGAECYGTSADDRNTTSGSTGSEYSTSQVTGSTFLPLRGFGFVDLPVHP